MNNNQTPNFGQDGSSFSKENVRPIKPNKKAPILPIILGGLLILVLIFANSFIFTVAEDEVAVVKVFSETKRVIVNRTNTTAESINDLDPRFKNAEVIKDQGLFFKIPFITTVEKHSAKLLTYISNTGQVTTRDRVKFEVQLYAQWRITHPGLYETNYATELNTSSKLDETLYADIIGLINSLESDTFLNDKETLYARLEERRQAYNDRIRDTGIEIQDLEIFRVAIPKSNFSSVYNKMNAERNAVAAGFKADGQKVYAETVSDVNLKVAQIEAAAIETAAQIKGEADAQAVEIYANAFSKDPEFYEFWRTLQAYENSIDENTTIYLDKSNPFLQYFSYGIDKGITE